MPSGSLFGLPYYARQEDAVQRTELFDFASIAPFGIFKVPGDRWIYVLEIIVKLTTSAVAATRLPFVDWKDPSGNLIAEIPSALSAGAGTSIVCHWLDGFSQLTTTGSYSFQPTLPVLLASGGSVSVLSNNLQAGDSFAGTSITYLEIPTGVERDIAVAPAAQAVPLLL